MYQKSYFLFSRFARQQYKITSLGPLSADADDTSSHQLLDLGADTRVLHVLVKRHRVGLSLLKNRLHHGVLHNAHNLERKKLAGGSFVSQG